MTQQDIINAYVRIREIDNTIPDEVLDFMKNAAIEKLEMVDQNNSIIRNFHKMVADDIDSYVEQYARLSPNFEPEDENDIDGKYTGPDVYELVRCAEDLRAGRIPERCWSEYGSGCYKRNDASEFLHTNIMRAVHSIINSRKK